MVQVRARRGAGKSAGPGFGDPSPSLSGSTEAREDTRGAVDKSEPSSTNREGLRQRFLALIRENQLERPEVARLLHVSVHTLTAWGKPESSHSSSSVPEWALELLALKIILRGGDRAPGKRRLPRNAVGTHAAFQKMRKAVTL